MSEKRSQATRILWIPHISPAHSELMETEIYTHDPVFKTEVPDGVSEEAAAQFADQSRTLFFDSD